MHHHKQFHYFSRITTLYKILSLYVLTLYCVFMSNPFSKGLSIKHNSSQMSWMGLLSIRKSDCRDRYFVCGSSCSFNNILGYHKPLYQYLFGPDIPSVASFRSRVSQNSIHSYFCDFICGKLNKSVWPSDRFAT